MGHRTPSLAACRPRRIESRRGERWIGRRCGLNLAHLRLCRRITGRHHARRLRRIENGPRLIRVAAKLCLRIVHRDLAAVGSREAGRLSGCSSGSRSLSQHGRVDAVLSQELVHAWSRPKSRATLLNGHRDLLIRHTAALHGDNVLGRQILLRSQSLRFSHESLLILGRPAVSRSAGRSHLWRRAVGRRCLSVRRPGELIAIVLAVGSALGLACRTALTADKCRGKQ